MATDKLPLWSILTIEGLLVCLVVILFLVLLVRKLRLDIQKLGARIGELKKQLRSTQTALPATPPKIEKSYRERLEEQLSATRDYHENLPGAGDIAMDLDPQTPEQRRVAAMRHALLVAEIDAHQSAGEPNWAFLADRYQQLLSFNRDYAPQQNPAELEQYRSRCLQLEQHWLQCHETASDRYTQLSQLVGQQADTPGLAPLLASYHQLHQDFNDRFFSDGAPARTSPANSHASADLQQLRALASHQHQAIDDLQNQLGQYRGDDIQHNLIVSLQTELQQQARFLRESATCIQVLEEELNAANAKLREMQGVADTGIDAEKTRSTG